MAEELFKDWLLEVKKDLKRRGAYWNPTLISGVQAARTVVLRGLEDNPQKPGPLFVIHTDIRSQKWQDLQLSNKAGLHFYCPKRKWQMRVTGHVSLHYKNDESLIEWKRLSSNSQKIYSLHHRPGTKVDDPHIGYTFDPMEKAYDHFGVISFAPSQFDSLQLSHPQREDLHIRAQWLVDDNKFSFLSP